MSRKILIVSPTPTHPNRAGNSSRIFYLCEALRKLEHEVHFVHIERDKSNRMQMKKYWGDRYTHLAYRSSFNFCVRYACKKWLMLLSPWHRYMQWNIDDWYSNHITKQILTLQKQCSFDTVIVEYVFLSKILEYLPSSLHTIIDTHDIFADRRVLYRTHNIAPAFFFTSEEEENKGLSRADAVIAIQSQDQKALYERIGGSMATIGHLQPPGNIVFNKKNNRAPRILLISSGNEINRHALEWVRKSVMPLVRKKIPTIELLLCGSICTVVMAEESEVLLGTIENLTEAYAHTDLVINPQQFGTGLSIKSIEALNAGMPLVTTAAGSRGLETGVGKALLQTNNAEEMANTIILLLKDKKKRQLLSTAAHQFAVDEYKKNVLSLQKLIAHEGF